MYVCIRVTAKLPGMTEPQQPKKLPIGVQSFEKLISEGYIYIDKTDYIHRLVTTGSYYFLSRPRRFGKSLLLSTLHAYFSGRKELFEGLKISGLEQDWTEYPVLHLDLNSESYTSVESLTGKLNMFLTLQEKRFGSDESERTVATRFEGIIRRAFEQTGHKVVVLVDEYDKPMLQAIGNEQLQNDFRNILKGFYGALKSMDGCIRFAFLTGVTKFGKVSVFSDLNNLNDISMDMAFHDICGITENELHMNFRVEVEELAAKLGKSVEDTYTELRENYDGYRFCSEDLPGIYNPFSLLNAFFKGIIGAWWFETGTPTYLVELLKLHQYNLSCIEKEEVVSDVLNCADIASTNPLPVIYQSGYLTIRSYDKEFGLYRLGFPNREVKQGFIRFLIPSYTNVDEVGSGFAISRFVRSLREGNIDEFMERLQSFLSACPYELEPEQERHFQSVMYILTTLCGYHVDIESHTNKGRMDMTVLTGDYIYIFEFKFNKTAQEALDQIDAKGYAERFAADGRTIIKVGVNFSTAARNIDHWVIA